MKKRKAAKELAPLLLDLVALSLDAKQAHWNVTGPHFTPLHGLFDSMTGEYRAWYDEVAERIRALGEPADGRAASVAKAASPMPAGGIEGGKAVALLLDRVGKAAERARAGIERLGELDPVSQDMVIGIVNGLEKQAWMLRAQAR